MSKSDLNILFSEPISSVTAVWGKFSKDSGTNNFLYGIASIAGYCRSKGFVNIKFIDPNLNGISREEYIEFLRSSQFDVIAMSSFTASISYTFDTFKLIKQVLPDCITIVGGIHASILPEESLRECKDIDIVIVGEGEITFCELLDAIKNDGNLKDIDGIVWRNGQEIIRNNSRKIISDLDILPMPAYDIFPMDKYKAQATQTKVFPTYIMMVSRGCYYDCAFCNATTVLGKKVRYKSPDAVINEILYLKNQFGAKGITFYDSTFTINKQWVAEFCEKLIAKNVNIYWNCCTRSDAINEDLLKLMKKAGCWAISFGVESGNQKSLDLIKKNNTVEQNTKGVQLAMKEGFVVTATYIIGIPGEDENDALNTIKYAKMLATPQALFYLPIPYPKTHLYNFCKEEGTLNPNFKWEDYNSLNFDNPIYINPKISKERMIELYNYAFKSYYRTPRVIIRNLMQINSKDAFLKYLMAMKCYLKFK